MATCKGVKWHVFRSTCCQLSGEYVDLGSHIASTGCAFTIDCMIVTSKFADVATLDSLSVRASSMLQALQRTLKACQKARSKQADCAAI